MSAILALVQELRDLKINQYAGFLRLSTLLNATAMGRNGRKNYAEKRSLNDSVLFRSSEFGILSLP